MSIDLDRLIATIVDSDASDLILKTGSQPAMKQSGKVLFLSEEKLTREEARQFFERMASPPIVKRLKPGTRISTDEWGPYQILSSLGYDHQTVDHGSKEYARGDVHVNSIEGFWSILKRSIRGTHVWVSKKHLSKYLGEFEYRYNMRKVPELMFDRLLASF